jgi:hypothetical protein
MRSTAHAAESDQNLLMVRWRNAGRPRLSNWTMPASCQPSTSLGGRGRDGCADAGRLSGGAAKARRPRALTEARERTGPPAPCRLKRRQHATTAPSHPTQKQPNSHALPLHAQHVLAPCERSAGRHADLREHVGLAGDGEGQAVGVLSGGRGGRGAGGRVGAACDGAAGARRTLVKPANPAKAVTMPGDQPTLSPHTALYTMSLKLFIHAAYSTTSAWRMRSSTKAPDSVSRCSPPLPRVSTAFGGWGRGGGRGVGRSARVGGRKGTRERSGAARQGRLVATVDPRVAKK